MSAPGISGFPRRILAVACPLLLAMTLVTACGKSSSSATSGATSASGAAPAASSTSGCPSTETESLAKTKFVLHAGLASGAFVHWIYQPFKAGELHLSLHDAGHIAKAALAGAFVVHELKVAKTDAQADPALCKVVVAPIEAVSGAFSGVVAKIKHGDVSDSDLSPVASGFSSLKQQAASVGSTITDQIPTAAQLANPSSTGS